MYSMQGDDCDDTDATISPADMDGDGVGGEVQTALSRFESFTGGFDMVNQDEVNCNFNWTVESTAATANCPTCESEFDLELTFENIIHLMTAAVIVEFSRYRWR